VTTDKVPFPLVFRFANNYLYGTVKYNEKAGDALAKDKLPAAPAVLAGPAGSVLSLTANLDQIPAQLRKLAVSSSALQLSNLKDQSPPNETEGQKKLREATLDLAADLVKDLMTDGRAVALNLALDRKKHDLSLTFNLGAREGSRLAKNMAALGKVKSATAGLVGASSAMGGYLSLALPPSLRKALGPVIDELDKKAAAGPQGELLKPLLDALKPTARSGVVDSAFDIRGPGAGGGRYTLVVGTAIRNGEEVEKALKEVLAKAPPDVKKAVKTDVARAGGVSVHQITPDKVDANTKEMFGEGPIYFAVRKDLVVLCGGEGAREAINEALGVQQKAARPLSFHMALSRMARLMERDNKGAQEAAKQAFKEKGSDRVGLTLEARQGALQLRLSTGTAVITFGSLMDKQKRGQKGE